MKAHTEYPSLEGLDKLVNDERRKVAGEMRCKTEGKELRAKLDAALAAADVDAVTVTIHLGTFEVRRAVSRNGDRYATVTKLPEAPA